MAGEFDAAARQYAPIAGVQPYQPMTGIESIPGASVNPLLAMLLQPTLAAAMSQNNMMPMTPDVNAWDALRHQRMWKLQMELQQKTSKEDHDTAMRIAHGLWAHLSTQPWGTEQDRAAEPAIAFLQKIEPFAEMFHGADDFIDKLGGSEGLQSIMAKRMMSAGRYRLDPVTGEMGMSPDNAMAQSAALYKKMFVNDVGAQGYRAGQIGELYSDLLMSGDLGGSSLTPREAVQYLADKEPAGWFHKGTIEEAAERQKITLPRDEKTGALNLGKLDAGSLTKLLGDSELSAKVLSIDTDKIKKTLEGYMDSLNAMRDIFGPDAPMSKLLGGLEALTMGAARQMDPGKLTTLVRMTQQSVEDSGLTMDQFTAMQDDAAAVAQKLNISPLFSLGAASDEVSFMEALKTTGAGKEYAKAWNGMTILQQGQLRAHLNMSAAASTAAQRIGLFRRLAATMGGVDEDSPAGAYLAALDRNDGLTTWVDPVSKKVRKKVMSQSDFDEFMTREVTFKNGARFDEKDLSVLQQSWADNRAYLDQQHDIPAVRRAQMAIDVNPRLSILLRDTLATQLRTNKGAAASDQIITDISKLDAATVNDPTKFDAATGAIIQRDLAKFVPVDKADAQKTAEIFRGNANHFLEGAYGGIGLKNLSAWHNQLNSTVDLAQVKYDNLQKIISDFRTIVAPYNRGGVEQSIFQYLQDVGAPGKEAKATVPNALSQLIGISQDDIKRKLQPLVHDITAKEKQFGELQKTYNLATTPEENAKYLKQLTELRDGLQADKNELTDTLARAGVKIDYQAQPADKALEPASLSGKAQPAPADKAPEPVKPADQRAKGMHAQADARDSGPLLAPERNRKTEQLAKARAAMRDEQGAADENDNSLLNEAHAGAAGAAGTAGVVKGVHAGRSVGHGEAAKFPDTLTLKGTLDLKNGTISAVAVTSSAGVNYAAAGVA